MDQIDKSFKQWISAFTVTDTNLGDLASDIARDPSFPDSSDKSVLMEYIIRKTHNSLVHRTLSAAIDLYHASDSE
ncbi:hypothetical protein B5E53_02385 [Eubacterium sp. An11]|uniref:YozE family protein n=1 Tax=Eubacterium sp. An11 TaxID=1965542 RepID=UPI000B367AF6|nr:YozE family protein [Eubacterium sp. An11]OUQ69608.1 hypothetical protein B5E53_02385 [Eubacterium sp. An11]